MSTDEIRARIRAECEAAGISGAKGIARAYEHDKFAAGLALAWIDEYERREAADREEAQRILSEKALAAAQLAAETSATAAEASRQSARWTMIAALIAGGSTIVTAALAIAQMLVK